MGHALYALVHSGHLQFILGPSRAPFFLLRVADCGRRHLEEIFALFRLDDRDELVRGAARQGNLLGIRRQSEQLGANNSTENSPWHCEADRSSTAARRRRAVARSRRRCQLLRRSPSP